MAIPHLAPELLFFQHPGHDYFIFNTRACAARHDYFLFNAGGLCFPVFGLNPMR